MSDALPIKVTLMLLDLQINSLSRGTRTWDPVEMAAVVANDTERDRYHPPHRPSRNRLRDATSRMRAETPTETPVAGANAPKDLASDEGNDVPTRGVSRRTRSRHAQCGTFPPAAGRKPRRPFST